MLPRDVSQQIFDELIASHCLTDVSLEAFRDCALQVIFQWNFCKFETLIVSSTSLAY